MTDRATEANQAKMSEMEVLRLADNPSPATLKAAIQYLYREVQQLRQWRYDHETFHPQQEDIQMVKDRLDAVEGRSEKLEALRCDRTARNVDEWLETILKDLDALKGKLRHENLKGLQHVLENLAACLPDYLTQEARHRIFTSVKPAIDSFAWGERQYSNVGKAEVVDAAPPAPATAEEIAAGLVLGGPADPLHAIGDGRGIKTGNVGYARVLIASALTAHAEAETKRLREELDKLKHHLAQIWGTCCPDCGPEQYEHFPSLLCNKFAFDQARKISERWKARAESAESKLAAVTAAMGARA